MHAVTLNKEVEKLSIKSPEFIQIENENKELRSELDEIKSDIDSLQKVKSELDGLKKVLGNGK